MILTVPRGGRTGSDLEGPARIRASGYESAFDSLWPSGGRPADIRLFYFRKGVGLLAATARAFCHPPSFRCSIRASAAVRRLTARRRASLTVSRPAAANSLKVRRILRKVAYSYYLHLLSGRVGVANVGSGQLH